MISVIIPCYNQAHFLYEVIESVLAQTHHDFEIIVVDDGSTDSTAEVAARYPDVRYVRQPNRGVATARNTGLRESKGEYLVFLDADDHLLPAALEIGLNSLKAHPECAFVFGNCRYIAADGSVLPTPHQRCVEGESYLALLHDCFIWTPGLVMHRRTVLESIAGFDTSLSLRNGEEYELYLRIAEKFPIHYYNETIVEYRQHEANKSSDPKRMLKALSIILSSQRKYIKKDERRKRAHRGGVKFYQEYYGEQVVEQTRASAKRGGENKLRSLSRTAE